MRFCGVFLAGLLLSGASQAQTFMCGSVSCSDAGANTGNGPLPTGISGLVVDGTTYNMTFSMTQNSNFNVQQGIDAGSAINAFFGTQAIPNPTQNLTSSFWYSMNGTPSQALYLQTAVTSTGDVYVEPFLDANAGPGIVNYGNAFPSTACGQWVVCTTWTKVNAPELNAANLSGALTLLAGIVAVWRGSLKSSRPARSFRPMER